MENTICFENINKAYGDLTVLHDFSASFPYGSVTAVTAPSGTGKTTLLRLLMELEPADSGSITGLSGLRKSAVFQEDRLCENLTALANIQLTAGNVSKDAIIASMEQISLSDCWYKPVRELSGGMKRRIAILRALWADYDLLLLDEPLKGLDSHTKDMVIDYIRQHIAGKTVILVTHDHTEIEKMGIKREITI